MNVKLFLNLWNFVYIILVKLKICNIKPLFYRYQKAVWYIRKSAGLGIKTRVQITALLLASCSTLYKLLNLPKLPLTHLFASQNSYADPGDKCMWICFICFANKGFIRWENWRSWKKGDWSVAITLHFYWGQRKKVIWRMLDRYEKTVCDQDVRCTVVKWILWKLLFSSVPIRTHKLLRVHLGLQIKMLFE